MDRRSKEVDPAERNQETGVLIPVPLTFLWPQSGLFSSLGLSFL